jgi:hypothetical protein
MSILATSPTSTRHFDMEIAEALGDINAAIIVQQLHYWMEKEEVGVIIQGVKYVYNTFNDWIKQQFKWLSVWQFRKAMQLLRSLEIVKVIRYKAKQWNQTNYYTLDRDRLQEYLKTRSAQSIEISEMWGNTDRDKKKRTLEMRDSDISYIETKTTTKKEATKQPNRDRQKALKNIAAASTKKAKYQEKSHKGNRTHSNELIAASRQDRVESKVINEDAMPELHSGISAVRSEIEKDKNSVRVDSIVNKRWQELIPLLDSTGIPINKTVINLLKLYSIEQVEGAIALFKTRKREQHIPNPSGYFVAALKGDWGGKAIVVTEPSRSVESSSSEIDTATVFRHWYDLAKELGYCSAIEIKEGEQWVCLSGTWEKWQDAVNRGYSLEYLKKVMKRNQGQ